MKLIKTSIIAAALAFSFGSAVAQEGIDDPTRAPYYDSFTGKRVAYVPVARGSSCVGLPFEALASRYGVRLLMVVRGAVLLSATDRSMLRAGDQVALTGPVPALTPCVAQLTASRAAERLA